MRRLIPKFLYSFLQKVRYIIIIVIYNILKIFIKMEKKSVFFLSVNKDYLSGNLLDIHNNIKDKDYKSYVEIYYQKSKFHKLKLLYYICKSKYILIDDYCPLLYPLKIRKNAKLIQVWHALGAFKKVGFSRIGKPGGPQKTSLTHRNYDATIVSSKAIVHNYAEAFGINKEKVYPIGIPRTDVFFDLHYHKEVKEKIYHSMPNLKGKKVILFAPTFRGDGKATAFYPNEFLEFDKIYKAIKNEYIFLVKYHPFIKNKEKIPSEYKESIIDVSNCSDINELLFITDILITDYSSVIFEYAFFKKPLIMYIPDIKDYAFNRDFYYPFDEYNYGKTCTNTNELIKVIKKPKVDLLKLEKFKSKFIQSCDGKSTERFVEELLK